MALYTTKKLLINSQQRAVLINDKEAELPTLSFELLLLLVSNSPNTLTIDQIIDTVWTHNVSDETVTQRIALIRKFLKTHNIEGKCIESVRGRGYRWLPEVQQVSNSKKNNSPLPSKATSLAIAVGVLLICGVLGWYYYQSKQNSVIPLNNSSDLKVAEYLKQANHYLGKFDDSSNEIAIDLYQQALSYEPNSLESLLGLSTAYSHKVTKYNGDEALLIQAIQFAKRASEVAPKNPRSWASLGFAYDAMGNIDNAIKYYRKSLDIDPNSKSTAGSLAYLLMIKGELAESLKLNLQVFDGSQHYRYLQIAENLNLLNSSQAESWFIKSMQLSPDNVFTASTYAKFLFSQGRLDEAKSITTQAIDKNIKQPDLYLVFALISIEQQNYKIAKEQLLTAKSISNNYEVKTWLLINDWLQNSVEPSLVQELSSAIANHNPDVNWPKTYINFALVQLVVGSNDEAISNILKAVQLGYSDYKFLKRIGQLLQINKAPRFIEALQLIEKRNLQEKNSAEVQELFNHSVLLNTL